MRSSPDEFIAIIFMKIVRAPFNGAVTLVEISGTTDLPRIPDTSPNCENDTQQYLRSQVIPQG